MIIKERSALFQKAWMEKLRLKKKKRQNTLGEIIFQDKAFIRNFKNKKLTFLKKALVLPLPLLLHPPDTLYFCVY